MNPLSCGLALTGASRQILDSFSQHVTKQRHEQAPFKIGARTIPERAATHRAANLESADGGRLPDFVYKPIGG